MIIRLKKFKKYFSSFLILILLLANGPPTMAADFIMKGNNPQRTHYVTDYQFPYKYVRAISDGNHLKNTSSGPIIENNIMYGLSTADDYVTAYDMINQKVLWSSWLPNTGDINGHPGNGTIVNDRLIIPAGNNIYVLNKYNGGLLKIINTYRSGQVNRFAGGPLHTGNGDVYMGSWNHRIYGFNALDGSMYPFLNYDTGGVVSSSGTQLNNGLVVFGVDAAPGKIIAINYNTRQVHGIVKTDSGVSGDCPTDDGLTVHCVDKTGKLYNWNPGSGSFNKANAISPLQGSNWKMVFAPALGNGYLYVSVNKRNTGEGYIYRYDLSGNYTQLYYSPHGIAGSPVLLSNNVVMFTTGDGYVKAIQGDTGRNYNWYQDENNRPSSYYKMSGINSYSELALGGGNKKVLLVNGADGIYEFEPFYPNIRATNIQSTDSNGNPKSTFYEDEQININGYFVNDGASAVSGVQHQLYQNGVGHDLFYEDYNIGDSKEITKTYSGLSPGTYTFSYMADPQNRIVESDKTDNQTQTITVTVLQRPTDIAGTDTKITDMSGNAKTTFAYGDPVVVKGYFKNISTYNKNATGVEHTQYLNGVSQGTLATYDYSVGETHVVSKAYGGLKPGTYSVYATADPNNKIAETDKTNNNTPTATFTVTAPVVPPDPTLPDIKSTSIKAYDQNGNENYTFNVGDPIRIDAIFQNIGNASTSNYEHQLIVNDVSSPIQTADYAVGASNTITTWFGNNSISTSSPQYMTALNPGVYQITAIADPNNKVAELDKGNNVSDTITIRVNSPDIRGESIRAFNTSTPSTSQSTFGVNDPIGIEGVFHNLGLAPATNVEHATYVDGKEVTTRILRNYGITPSDYSNTIQNTIGTLPRGTHTIKMVADPDNKLGNQNNKTVQLKSAAPIKPTSDAMTFSNPGDSTDTFRMTNLGIDTSSGGKNTVEFWMKWDGTDSVMPISFDSSNNLDLYLDSGFFGFNTQMGDVIGIPDYNLKNQWVHVAAVFYNGDYNDPTQASQLKLYINGQLQTLQSKYFGAPTSHQVPTVGTNINVSGNDLGQYRFSGQMAEVRVWKGERTQQQIQDNMNTIATGNETNLVGYLTPPHNAATFTDNGTMRFNAPNLASINTTAGGKNTVEFWMKWNGTDYQMPFSFYGTGYDVFLAYGHIGFNTGKGDVQAAASFTATNKWVHIAAVFNNGLVNASTCKIYINGVQQAVQDLGTPPPGDSFTASNGISMGGLSYNNTYGFGGQLGKVTVFNQERSPAQISNDMIQSPPADTTGLVGIWTPDIHTTSTFNNLYTNVSDGVAADFNSPQFENIVKNNGVQLYWEDAGENATYEVQRDGVTIYSGTDHSFFDSQVTQQQTYQYTLKIITPHGESDATQSVEYTNNTVQMTVTVKGNPPIAKFAVGASFMEGDKVPFTNQTTEADGDPISYSWLVKKATDPDSAYTPFSNDVNPVKLFDQPGNFTVKLIASDIDGESNYTQNLTINTSQVVAGFTDDSPYYLGDQCTLTSGAYDKNGLPITYNYNITRPDGTSFTSTDQNPSFTCDQVGQYKVTQTVTNSIGNTASYTDNVTVVNRQLTAGFIDDSPYIVGDTINITNTAKGAAGATLSYSYTVVRPDQTTFTDTSTNPSFIGTQLGEYLVKQTVTDNFGDTAYYEDYVIVDNLPPIAGFTTDKTNYFTNETVNVTSTAIDGNGDPLTYDYIITAPDGSTVTSTDVNPSFSSLKVGTYSIYQKVTDPYGAYDEYTSTIQVDDRPPNPGFTTDKPFYNVGDTMSVTSTASDPDNDPLTYAYQITDPNGVVSTQTVPNFTVPANVAGNYIINQTVCDPFSECASTQSTVGVSALGIIGHVDHTPDWTTKHTQLGHNPLDFYSGETFVLHADVSSAPKDYVKVTFTSPLVSGGSYTETVQMNKDSEVLFSLDYIRDSFSQPATLLQNGQGTAVFTFEVGYSNGTVKTDVVKANIIGTIFDTLNYHRSF